MTMLVRPGFDEWVRTRGDKMMDAGTRVRFKVDFLRSTGQYTGPSAPIHYGPFARGRVVGNLPNLPHILEVEWENGEKTRVNAENLERTVR